MGAIAYATKVGDEPTSCDRGRRENDAFILSATLPTTLVLCCKVFIAIYGLAKNNFFVNFLNFFGVLP